MVFLQLATAADMLQAMATSDPQFRQFAPADAFNAPVAADGLEGDYNAAEFEAPRCRSICNEH